MVSPEAEFAHILREAAAPVDAELAEFESNSSVLEYAKLFKGLFPLHPKIVETSPRPLKIVDCSFERASQFGYALILAQCKSLEDMDASKIAQYMSKTLKKGGDQLMQVLDRYGDHYNIDTFDCKQYTPDCLMRLSSNALLNHPTVMGLDQESPLKDIWDAHDSLLLDACQRIIENKKFNTLKSCDPVEDVFIRSMNSVRVMYHTAEHSHFANSFMYAAGAAAIGNDINNLNNYWLKNTNGEQLRFELREYLLNVNAGDEAFDIVDCFDPAIFIRTLYNRCDKNTELLCQKMLSGTAVARQVNLARRLVDTVAKKESVIGDTTIAYMHSQQTALKMRENIELEETLKWQKYDKSKRPKLRKSRPPVDSEEWHRDCSVEQTLDRLEAIIDLWGEGEIMRSCIPDRAEDEQYFVAVLPERRLDGEVLEHGIADFPNDRDAIYFWRAEKGLNRYDEIELTWREIFSQKKAIMRERGAKKMLHTSSLDERLVEFLTRDPRRLSERKYQIGRGAIAGLVSLPDDIASQ